MCSGCLDLPNNASTAAVTAPHPSWPMTTKAGMEVLRRIGQGAHHVIGDHVSRHTHDEEVAKAFIEHQFGRNTRVATAENRGIRMLLLRQSLARLPAGMRHSWLILDESGVAG